MDVLTISDLEVHFSTANGVVKAVNGVDFSIGSGEIMALVGESGSGKSITGLSILGLVPKPNGKVVNGRILFNGEDLVGKTEKHYRKIRGQEIAMIFQNPLSAMDPSFTVGNQLLEIIRDRQGLSRVAALNEAKKLLDLVGIHDHNRVLNAYPHALSGGMRQRAMIAMALSCKPKLLIADEPTTALDATIQKQILSLLKKINQELNTSILFITHDFGVVANLCDRVGVMYAGRILEYGKTEEILKRPKHPYTKGLMDAMPETSLEAFLSTKGSSKKFRLKQITGSPPDLLDLPSGCHFYERCERATSQCLQAFPEVKQDKDHLVRCFHEEEIYV
ncbi:ABC transporter ATP-binding protein [Pullulanibacillus sp. KACC 23026]|uniref:ABC transporter ATP-binding protein n=1 Tax=Pullulanibacillus sp. KACC 23026 TaxID=3028315 RepID=UPI0023B1EE21|nr:ABC transporter ATP-binding protein [Pullulanibacillus sp. KACC 23026]WEG11026.1 ABC transporter ATP-binding protein [Pullulanibacillus sp. KACC 23026]